MRAAALLLLALPCAAAEPGFDWILNFENGDTLHCRLEALENGRLVVRWAVTPDEPIRFDLKAIAYLVRAGEEHPSTEPPADVDVLRLADDSILFGRAASVTPGGVEFDVEQVGRLSIPAADIIDLTRGRHEASPPAAKEDEFAVVMRSGSALSGKLRADDRGRLLLESDGLTAAIDFESLAVIVFPRPEPTAVASEPAPATPGVQVRLRNGSVLGGKDPTLAEGILRLKAGGLEAALPVAELAAIAFQDYQLPVGRIGMRAVLAWGRWSDPAEEFRRSIDIVKGELEGRWRIQESTAEKFDESFRRALFAARTLLIPEMEKMAAPAADAAELKPLLQSFLSSGGNVVVCGAQGAHLQWLREAGLMELDGTGTVDGQEVRFTGQGAAIGKGIGSFTAMNATFSFVVRSPDAVVLADAGGKPVVVGRRVGRGWVVVIGLDYYMTNEGASRLLCNAVQLR